MALMPGHHVNLVTFNLAAESDLRLPLNDPLTKLRGHLLGIVGVQVQLLGDLLVREVQPHEVEAQGPDPQRLVMAGEDRPSQVVETPAAGGALIALPFRLGVVLTLLRDLRRVAMRAADAVRPAQPPDRFVALGVVDERLDVQ